MQPLCLKPTHASIAHFRMMQRCLIRLFSPWSRKPRGVFLFRTHIILIPFMLDMKKKILVRTKLSFLL